MAEIDFVPTEGMASAAKRALKWKEEGKPGGTAVGLARAHQLAKREKLSERTVLRMYSFFSRHEPDKQASGFNSGEEGFPSKGRVAWDLWGGDGGYSWSKTKRDQIMRARDNKSILGRKGLGMEELITALKAAFASEYAFYLKAQNFHWNVEGEYFPQLHELFGKIYSEVGDSIDDFAENIRKVGAKVPASFPALNRESVVAGQDGPLDCTQMLQQLLLDSENMSLMFANVYERAEEARKYGLANFLADRQDAHDKHSWMLRVTLIEEPDAESEME